MNYIDKRTLKELLYEIRKTVPCDIDSDYENIHCKCSSVEDSGFPDISILIGDKDNEAELLYESKHYLIYHEAEEMCRLMIAPDYGYYSNVWIMGEPFLKAYYTGYNYEDGTISFVRVADKTHGRYTVVDNTRHNYRCTR